jgi:hypothetical protein
MRRWRGCGDSIRVRKLTHRGLHKVLPIVGDTLVEISLSTCRLPVLVFKAEDGSEAELTIEECITLTHGNQERHLVGSKPGALFNPKELAPLLQLLGGEVKDALAKSDGHLTIAFSNATTIDVKSTDGYEAWHFHYPRPGRPVGGKLSQSISLIGASGHLIGGNRYTS